MTKDISANLILRNTNEIIIENKINKIAENSTKTLLICGLKDVLKSKYLSFFILLINFSNAKFSEPVAFMLKTEHILPT